MKSIDKIIEGTYIKKAERGWDTLYWLVDVHDTMIKGSYDPDEDFANVYPFCKETLSLLSRRTDTVLIIWTSSYPSYVQRFMTWLSDTHGIEFKYYNQNPECKNTETGYFESKPYFNIILDDKAGFEAEKDWEIVYNKMKEVPDVN